jgi:hypothetical protein
MNLGYQGDTIAMFIHVIANGNTTVFKLNNSPAAKDLYAQLPMRIAVEGYGSNEKIFYPPKKLDISNAPRTNSLTGTLACYAPWGDVVMFYKKFSPDSGLYEFGQAVSGGEYIQEMSGIIDIVKSDEQ